MTPNRHAPRNDGSDPPAWRRSRDAGFCAGILLLTLLIYWPALNGALLWDDPAHVTRTELRSTDGLKRIWFEVGATQQYYPVLHTAFWIQHRWWGDATAPYHLANVLLHAANCCLLAFLLRRLWRGAAIGPTAEPAGTRVVPAGTEWLAAGLFAVHPVCVESVAWISEQKNTLSTAFYLLSAICYLDFARRRGMASYGLAFALFLLALGTKTMTVTLPPALLVVLWWRQGRLEWKRDIGPLLPWFATAIVAGAMTAWVERKFIGAEGVAYDLSFLQRGLLAARIFWFYLGKLFWPADLTFFYERWDVTREAAGWLTALIAGLAVTAALWRLRRKTRGPLAGWLLFGGSLFPALGFFNVFPFQFSYVADHFQYLAGLGIIALSAAGFGLGLTRFPLLPRWAGWSLAGCLLLGLGWLARQQSRLYVDNETLFRANIATNPSSWNGHHLLAYTLTNKSPEFRTEAETLYRKAIQLKADNADSHHKLGLLLVERPETRDEAIEHYREALRIRPAFPEAHNSLAIELATMPGRLPEAIEHYREAIRIRPRFVYAHANLAQALTQIPGHQSEALEHFAEALRLFPGYATAHYNLANLLATMPGRQTDAIAHYEAALRLQPDAAEAHANLADILRQQPDRVAEALAHYEAALRLQPDAAEVQANFANTLALQPGRLPEALTHYATALQLNPNLAWVHYNLALHLAGVPGRFAEAVSHGEMALQLRPEYVEAHNLLGILLAQSGRLEAAKTHWREALRLNPRYEPAKKNLSRVEPAGGE